MYPEDDGTIHIPYIRHGSLGAKSVQKNKIKLLCGKNKITKSKKSKNFPIKTAKVEMVAMCLDIQNMDNKDTLKSVKRSFLSQKEFVGIFLLF